MKIRLLIPLCLLLAAMVARPAKLAAQTKIQLDRLRSQMVDEDIIGAGIKNKEVIESIRNTPRHEFMAPNLRPYAYYDMALPIGDSQTISPPFIVAYMTEKLDPQSTDKVLEIGTGSGYQAAVLSPLAKEVYSIEIVKDLGEKAGRTLRRLKYANVHTKVGDGYLGWPEHAPFDKIIVTCSPEKVPAALVEQLREGGRMIVPVGERYQQILYLLTKKDGKLVTESLQPTLFVPMTGAAEEGRKVLPDPLHPQIVNGSFEELLGDSQRASGWHYQRQMQVVKAPADAQQGDYYARFTNEQAGRTNQALQGFAIDGRHISAIDVSLWVKGESLRYGEDRHQWPRLVITFYDENRGLAGEVGMGPYMGTFGWRKSSKRIEVPLKAREAIIRIGLLGGIGEMCVDDLQLEPVK
jgi:protein-L-isoaspartate(D-aspartate) O-methyltransferase